MVHLLKKKITSYLGGLEDLKSLYIYCQNLHFLETSDTFFVTNLFLCLKGVARAENVYLNLMNNGLYQLFLNNFFLKNSMLKYVRRFYLNLGYCELKDWDLEVLERFKRAHALNHLILEISGNPLTSKMYVVLENARLSLSKLQELEVRVKLDSLEDYKMNKSKYKPRVMTD